MELIEPTYICFSELPGERIPGLRQRYAGGCDGYFRSTGGNDGRQTRKTINETKSQNV